MIKEKGSDERDGKIMPIPELSDYTKYAERPGGKGNRLEDGFYSHNSNKQKVFIKVPSGLEAITELFGGLFIDLCKESLIPLKFHRSFITASLIKVNAQEYGLIQPAVEFKELHKIIGTSATLSLFEKRGDRSALWEAALGPQHYQSLEKVPKGLAFAVMFAGAICNNSFHSGNVVILNDNKQGALIDWGATGRGMGDTNYLDIRKKKECAGFLGGIFNYKAYTKNYFQQLQTIPGFTEEVVDAAKWLLLKIDKWPTCLEMLVLKTLNQIPASLFNDELRKEFAKHTHLPCEDICTKSDCKSNQKFAAEFARTMRLRIENIANLPIQEAAEAKTKLAIAGENLDSLIKKYQESSKQNDYQDLQLAFENLVDQFNDLFPTAEDKRTLDELRSFHVSLVANKKAFEAIIKRFDDTWVNPFYSLKDITDQYKKLEAAYRALPKILQVHFGNQKIAIDAVQKDLLDSQQSFEVSLKILDEETSIKKYEEILKKYDSLPPILKKYFKEVMHKITDGYRSAIELVIEKTAKIKRFENACIHFHHLHQTDTFEQFRAYYHGELKSLYEAAADLELTEVQGLKANADKLYAKTTKQRRDFDSKWDDFMQNLNMERLESYPKLAKEYAGLAPILQSHFRRSKEKTDQLFNRCYPQLINKEPEISETYRELSKAQFKILTQNIDRVPVIDVLSRFRTTQLRQSPNQQSHTIINNFHREAIDIVLTQRKTAIHTQLRQKAHEHFQHRHYSARIFADCILSLAIIPMLLVGTCRKLAGCKTFFFSHAPTQREDDLAEAFENNNRMGVNK